MHSTNTNRVDVYQIITDRLIAILEAGTVPWRKPWNYGNVTLPPKSMPLKSSCS